MIEETAGKLMNHKKPASRRVFAVLVILYLAVTLPLAYLLNIWTDEASTLHTTEHGFLYACRHVFADEKQAPLYFLVMSLWREIDHSVFFARLFSIICGIFAIRVFYGLTRKLFEYEFAVFAAAIFALHPYFIWAGLEIRLYSLVILFSALLLKLFFELYLDEKDSGAAQNKTDGKKRQILFIVLSITALYINYYLGFLLFGFFVALLILKRWRSAKTYFLQMMIVGISLLPLLLTIRQEIAVRAVSFNEDKPLLDGIKILWNHFLFFVLPTEFFSPAQEATPMSFVRVWLVRLALLAVVFLLIKTRGKFLDKKMIALGATGAVCSALLLCIYLFLGAKYVELRHSVNVFVPLILLISLLFSKLLPKNYLLFAAVLYAVFFTYSIYNLYPNLAKRGDWARVGDYIEKNEKPNQPIIIFKTYDALALPYHYRGANKILPDEKFFDWEPEDVLSSPAAFKRQTEFIISKIPPDAPEIWLLTDETCQNPAAKIRCQPLENFVEENYTIEDTKDFYLERVRLLRRK